MTSKGQVAVPSEIRKSLNLQEGDYLIFEATSDDEANVKVVRSVTFNIKDFPKLNVA
jgi:AbrB family looped-hinge helix DNA binding protein